MFLSCKDEINVNDKNKVSVNVNDKDNILIEDKDNFNVNDNVNRFHPQPRADDNDNLNDNDEDEFIYLFGEKHPRVKLNTRTEKKENPRSGYTDRENKISNNVIRSLQLCLIDEEFIVTTAFPENFRCIISGPSECGKTFLLKELIISNIYF